MRSELTLSDAVGETRLLREHTTGYSVALPGEPTLAPMTEGYDAIVRLQAIKVEHGFRFDTISSSTDPEAQAKALAIEYATRRAGKPQRVRSMSPHFSPTGTFGSEGVYPVASVDSMVAQVWVIVRPIASETLVLYATTRFLTTDLDKIEWNHLRGANLDQHRWDEEPRDVPALWPDSSFIHPSAKLVMTDAAAEEALVKAAAIGPLTDETAMTLVKGLIEIAHIDKPPQHVLLPGLIDECIRRFKIYAPGRASEAMLTNIERCTTMHDLRGWVWQCVWAMRNRHNTLGLR